MLKMFDRGLDLDTIFRKSTGLGRSGCAVHLGVAYPSHGVHDGDSVQPLPIATLFPHMTVWSCLTWPLSAVAASCLQVG